MDLVKIICGMLAFALILGLFTSGGDHDETEAISLEPEPGTGDEAYDGVKNVAPTTGENVTEALTETVGPDPLILAKGESKMANERKNIENRVKATVRLIEAQGEKLFPGFRQEESAWYHDGFYIFVWTINGTQVVCPPDTKCEGQDMRGLLDADNNPLGELFIATALSEKGEGWVDYNWKKTSNSEPSRKYTFVKRATFEGRSYLVGSSFDLDNFIVSRNLNECEYLEESGNIRVAELFHPKNFDQNLDVDYSIAHSIIEPGEHIEPHMMKNPEVHYILEGEGTLYIDGIPVELRPDQLVYIPSGAIQTTYNTGNTTLKFLAINQPAWSEKNTQIL